MNNLSNLLSSSFVFSSSSRLEHRNHHFANLLITEGHMTVINGPMDELASFIKRLESKPVLFVHLRVLHLYHLSGTADCPWHLVLTEDGAFSGSNDAVSLEVDSEPLV